VLRNNPETKAMSTDVHEHISSQIANELESGARLRLKPWNTEHATGRITHPLRGTSRADVKGVSNATA
jgi:antirestriction protein ArdC